MSESRHILHPGNEAVAAALKSELETICGSAQLLSFQLGSATYFNVEAEIPGQGPLAEELVVVGAHLDSTAAKDPGYQADVDPAPGADDDASGVLAVLAVARTLRLMADSSPPGRTIRFVLFNAEEQGMYGSLAYARDLSEAGSFVAAMLAMDMIGWHPKGNPPFRFEIHGTGIDEYYTAKAASDDLTNLLVQTAGQVAPGTLKAEVYPLPQCGTDPATLRSDHSRFHYHGWAACLLSEDLWVATCGLDGGTQTGNPAYHTQQDLFQFLDLDYVAAIARTAAATAWITANP